jgi:hypothetical protein
VPLVTGLAPLVLIPMARRVVVVAIETGPAYKVDAVVGVLPSVV